MQPVKLEEIVIALDTDSDDFGNYLDKATGETIMLEDRVYYFVDEYLDMLRDPNTTDEAIEELIEEERINYITGEWDAESIRQLATETFSNLVCIDPLPAYEKYAIMEDFIATEEDERIRSLLYVSIEGKGAFRRFKDSLAAIGRLQEYFGFFDDAMKEKACAWCKDKGVPYTE